MQTLKLTKKYEKYPEYKDSGVEWLGKIPKGWEQKKFKFIAQYQKGKNPNDLSLDQLKGSVPYLSMEYLRGSLENLSFADPSQKVLANNNDLILLCDGSNAGEFIEAKAGIVSSTASVIKFSDVINTRFGFYFAKSFEQYLKDQTTGAGIPHVDMDLVSDCCYIVPSLKLQDKIVKFLDEKTFSIDQIIERKQSLIELLKEKRTALINHALVDVDGRTSKIKNHVLVNPTKKIVSATDLEDRVSFVPMEAISENGTLVLQEKKYKEVKDGFTYFRDGDVVLAKITPCYENGKAGVMKDLKNGFGFGTTEFMVLRPNDSIMADYLYYLIYSDRFRKSGEVEMRGTAGQKRVTATFVRNYEFLLPTLEKQKEIVNLLNKKNTDFDVSISKIVLSIKVLKEFKSSLISSVVTGKIKV